MELELRAGDLRAHLSVSHPVLVYAIPCLAAVLIAWAVVAWGMRKLEQREKR